MGVITDYSGTSYTAQGKTEDHAIGIIRSVERHIDLSTQRAFYVMLSRARKSAKLITDDLKNLSRSIASKTGDKTSGIEHMSGKQANNLEEVKKSNREIYIARNQIDSLQNNHQDYKSLEIIKKQHDYKKAYESFVNDRILIEKTAIEFFGAMNPKLSKGDSLRFGNKGSISVNLTNGQWYDFKSGEGGSLYKFHKELHHNSQSQYIAKELKLSKPIDQDIAREKKIQRVEQISKYSAPLNEKTTAANNYLKTHRKIELNNINVSPDIKFSSKLWSSETNSNYLGLVAVARDKSGKETAVQMIYLDEKIHNKNKNLEINKRTMGVLKGSFVELTQNLKSNTVYVAEGIETGLSIASTEKDARVICALGISNMSNISKYLREQDQGKNITIVADNDGKESVTGEIIERALVKLADEGYKNLELIRPEISGYDFNDVLKIRGEKGIKKYTENLFQKYPNIRNKLEILNKQIENKVKELNGIKDPLLNYKDIFLAKKNWEDLKKKVGVEKTLVTVSKNPILLGKLNGSQFLGIQNKERKKAEMSIKLNIDDLVTKGNLEKNIKLQIEEIKEITADYLNRKDFAKIKTKGLDKKSLEKKLNGVVKNNLGITDNKTDYLSVKRVTEKIADKIISYRNTYGIEVESRLKQQYFLESRYELEKEVKWEKYISEKNIIKKGIDIVKQNEIVRRLVNIDTKLSNREGIYYTAVNDEKIVAEYKENTDKIVILTKELAAKGYGEQGTEFIAQEMIKYQEKNGETMPMRQIENLCSVSGYVQRNYNQLTKSGFDKYEARIAFVEGEKIFHQYDRGQDSLIINKNEVKEIQKQSKDDLARQPTEISSDVHLDNQRNRELKHLGIEI